MRKSFERRVKLKEGVIIPGPLRVSDRFDENIFPGKGSKRGPVRDGPLGEGDEDRVGAEV